jgi:hypothetical protein
MKSQSPDDKTAELHIDETLIDQRAEDPTWEDQAWEFLWGRKVANDNADQADENKTRRMRLVPLDRAKT